MAMITSKSGEKELRKLLQKRNQSVGSVAHIDREIRKKFEREVAYLCLDMSGFSRLTAKYGIIHFLALLEEMEEAVRPAVSGNGGIVLRREADNVFAIFQSVENAMDAAEDIFRSFAAMNAVLPSHRDLHGSIGIGYGKILVIGNHDAFGDEVNSACKLGEDLAKRGEILLTQAAYKALDKRTQVKNGRRFEARSYRVSGIKLSALRVKST